MSEEHTLRRVAVVLFENFTVLSDSQPVQNSKVGLQLLVRSGQKKGAE